MSGYPQFNQGDLVRKELCIDSMNTVRNPQREAIEYLHWEIRADDLLARLFSSPNRHTRRLYAADLEHFRSWLQTRSYEAESLPLMLAILSSHGQEHAAALACGYRDHMLGAGYRTGTVNRHLCTLRRLARLMRRMGRIDWDLADVHNLRTDNSLRDSPLTGIAA